jgi:predicted enzyme related to lactoylglutathione lyase
MRKLAFASLQVRDLEVSKDFYTRKLGFELSDMSNPYACVFKYDKGEASFAIRTAIGNIEGKELGVGASLWFAIDEKIEELQSQLAEKGVTLIGAINHTPFGKTLMAKDPDGYIITFLEQSEYPQAGNK